MSRHLKQPLLILSLMLGLSATSALSPNAYASDDHPQDEHKDEHGDEHGEEHDGPKGQIKLSPQMITQSDIQTIAAAGGEIKQSLRLYGKVKPEPSAVSHVHARFAGLITQLSLNIGDKVGAGEVVAEVESNYSLERYAIKSPISGVVVARHANPGELTNQQSLLTIANYQQLWVEYQVFANQRQALSTGLAVTVSLEKQYSQSSISQLLPGSEQQAFSLARVPLDNHKGQWSVGMLLAGDVITSKVSVPLVIDNQAVQLIDGNTVVFVKNPQGFIARPVSLGQSDGQYSEVLKGLALSEHYAVKNSFLLKAELEKSAAEHHH